LRCHRQKNIARVLPLSPKIKKMCLKLDEILKRGTGREKQESSKPGTTEVAIVKTTGCVMYHCGSSPEY
jgi:hypothetical protein